MRQVIRRSAEPTRSSMSRWPSRRWSAPRGTRFALAGPNGGWTAARTGRRL